MLLVIVPLFHPTNKRHDPQLKALVYKLVTGLSQSEEQRRHAFDDENLDGPKPSIANGLTSRSSASHAVTGGDDNGDDVDAGNGYLNGYYDDAEYFSADDPIRYVCICVCSMRF